MPNYCGFPTRKGTPCKKYVKDGKYCFLHAKKNLVSPTKQVYNDKFKDGEQARIKWNKNIDEKIANYDIHKYNKKCNNHFIQIATISLDDSTDRKTTLKVDIQDEKKWNSKKEHIYIIVRNDKIIKIGGTRTGMKNRWSSYLCGYFVPQRTKKNGTSYLGKMSVTNAYLYHTIEQDLLTTQSTWTIYIWKLPNKKYTENILGKNVEIISQTFHAYETRCIEKYKELTGHIPLLSSNCDPRYK